MDKKPMLLVNEDLSEGVYAASGDSDNGMSVELMSRSNWGKPHHFSFKVTLPDGLNNHIKTTFVFDADINDFYGGGGLANHNGRTGTIEMWSHGKTFEFTALSNNETLNVISKIVENV